MKINIYSRDRRDRDDRRDRNDRYDRKDRERDDRREKDDRKGERGSNRSPVRRSLSPPSKRSPAREHSPR